MNRFSLFIALLIACLFHSCQDTKENVQEPLSEKDIYKTIGEAIPFETGMEWIEFYRNREYTQGRLDLLAAYSLSATNMVALLESTPTLVGVVFHYGLDELGQKHIVVIPVGESLSLWSADARIFADANEDSQVSMELAARWAENYKAANPDEIWFHFFGKDVFDAMHALPYYDEVAIEPAINVLDLTPQLLLVVLNDNLVSTGRTTEEAGTVYDASNPCPPCAVK